MNVASLDLCKELFVLAGWSDTDFDYNEEGKLEPCSWLVYNTHPMFDDEEQHTPAYDLGYLLRKLPNDASYRTDMARDNDCWAAYLWGPSKFETLGSRNKQVIARGVSESPEDAVTKLAIELFNLGVLVKDTVS